jgi:hypothetical protein
MIPHCEGLIVKSNEEAGKDAACLEATDLLFVATYILL